MNINFKHNNYLDFHTHKIRRQDHNDITEIISIHLEEETKLPLYTIGKHPWFTDSPLSNKEKKELKTHLQNKNCLALGEIGLDKLKGVNLELQAQILRQQLDIALELQKPVIIHCVRTFDQLLQIKKDYPKLKKWCIHGYARHVKLAKQLIEQGFYLSLMPQKLSDSYIELIKSIPNDKLFLETDSMPNIKIEDLYLRASKILNITLDDLKSQIMLNAKTFFYK